MAMKIELSCVFSRFGNIFLMIGSTAGNMGDSAVKIDVIESKLSFAIVSCGMVARWDIWKGLKEEQTSSFCKLYFFLCVM